MKKIVVVVGNPIRESFSGAMAESYANGAREAGHKVKVLYLGEMDFEVVLRKGYGEEQKMEKDLVEASKDMVEADHLVFSYPVWWGEMPALLRGFVERSFLPGVAFKYKKERARAEKLFLGKTARLLVGMDSSVFWQKVVLWGGAERVFERAVLNFCGIKLLGVNYFGKIRKAGDDKKAKWLGDIYELGMRGI